MLLFDIDSRSKGGYYFLRIASALDFTVRDDCLTSSTNSGITIVAAFDSIPSMYKACLSQHGNLFASIPSDQDKVKIIQSIHYLSRYIS